MPHLPASIKYGKEPTTMDALALVFLLGFIAVVAYGTGSEVSKMRKQKNG